MAIDTAEKRRSVAGIAFWAFGPGVTPNAAKDQEWRQEVGRGYSGIAAGGAPPEPAAGRPAYQGLRRDVGRLLG